jgi:hypothetical protein
MERKCRHREICKKSFHVANADNCSHESSLSCPIFDKIEDVLMDSLPFSDEYDGPEPEGDETL